jgi:hypothetical protein
MPVSMALARRLCTQRELELVEASTPRNVKALTPGRLKQKADRARTLRNKYRDLARRQRLEARGKTRPRSRRAAQGNENTVRKAELFDDALARFLAQLDARKKAATTKAGGTSKKTRAAKPATPAKRAGGKQRRGGSSPAAGQAKPASPRKPGAAARQGARQRTSQEREGARQTIRAHTRAANRRGQVRRDRR